MQTSLSAPLLRHATILVSVVAFAAGAAGAQTTQSSNPSNDTVASVSESSSSAGLEAAEPGAMPAAPAAQNDRGGGGYRQRDMWSHMTYEAGGGFNAPTSYTSQYITWGGNLTVGAGYRFDPHVSMLAEYQFIDSKLPGAIIAETGSNGGHAHIWSFTLAPVIDVAPRSKDDVYVTGGGGFYRKVTSFTDIVPTEYCTYFFCGVGLAPQVVGHFSSNQGGWNVGVGFTHRLAGLYGDGRTKLFAEARYLDVETPAVTTSANGLPVTSLGADTKTIPVTLGVRW